MKKGTLFKPRGLQWDHLYHSYFPRYFCTLIESTNKYFRKKNVKNRVYCKGYVDDIIFLYKGSTKQIQLFGNYLNKLNPNLQITIKQKNHISKHFLWFNNIRNRNPQSFRICRKPTHTYLVIHAKSNHPQSHKLAAFKFRLYRLVNTPSWPWWL